MPNPSVPDLRALVQQWREITTAPEAERVFVWVPNFGIKIAQKTTHPSDGAVWWDGEEIVSKPTRWLPLPKGPQP